MEAPFKSPWWAPSVQAEDAWVSAAIPEQLELWRLEVAFRWAPAAWRCGVQIRFGKDFGKATAERSLVGARKTQGQDPGDRVSPL